VDLARQLLAQLDEIEDVSSEVAAHRGAMAVGQARRVERARLPGADLEPGGTAGRIHAELPVVGPRRAREPVAIVRVTEPARARKPTPDLPRRDATPGAARRTSGSRDAGADPGSLAGSARRALG